MKTRNKKRNIKPNFPRSTGQKKKKEKKRGKFSNTKFRKHKILNSKERNQ
jgi:hypothetical protein